MIDSSDQLETLNPYVSRETIKKLSDYRDSIISAKFNLVSKKDKDHIWIRHFHDSLRLTKFFEKNPKKMKILDIGSGAGLPGLPLSMVLDNDLFEFVLCESNNKKANFIKDCCDRLDISNVQIIKARQKLADLIVEHFVQIQLLIYYQDLMLLDFVGSVN